MPMNRMQFQKGLSLGEFMIRCGTEEQCIAALAQSRWPSGFVCPSCRDTGTASSCVMAANMSSTAASGLFVSIWTNYFFSPEKKMGMTSATYICHGDKLSSDRARSGPLRQADFACKK